jgi:hypothetical protein
MLYGTRPFASLKVWWIIAQMKLSINLNDSQADLLKQTAAKLGVAVEDLARAAVSDLLVAEDSEFSEAASRVLEKNRELYERLS